MAALRLLDGVEYLLQLFVIIVGYHLEVVGAESTYQRERCVQHQSRLRRSVTVVVGVTDSDRTDVTRPTATHAGYAERRKAQQ